MTATTITIEFTKPEDANKIIDEGLIWQMQISGWQLAKLEKLIVHQVRNS